MSQNPFNLAVRFVLEIVALIALGYGGWHASDNFMRYLLAAGLPLLGAFLWGGFRPPHEPHHPKAKHATIAVSGKVRLLIEAAIFGGATWALFGAGATTTAWIFTVVLLLHYAVSYDRVAWLLRH